MNKKECNSQQDCMLFRFWFSSVVLFGFGIVRCGVYVYKMWKINKKLKWEKAPGTEFYKSNSWTASGTKVALLLCALQPGLQSRRPETSHSNAGNRAWEGPEESCVVLRVCCLHMVESALTGSPVILEQTWTVLCRCVLFCRQSQLFFLKSYCEFLKTTIYLLICLCLYIYSVWIFIYKYFLGRMTQ